MPDSQNGGSLVFVGFRWSEVLLGKSRAKFWHVYLTWSKIFYYWTVWKNVKAALYWPINMGTRKWRKEEKPDSDLSVKKLKEGIHSRKTNQSNF
jgi:hypothetical protein